MSDHDKGLIDSLLVALFDRTAVKSYLMHYIDRIDNNVRDIRTKLFEAENTIDDLRNNHRILYHEHEKTDTCLKSINDSVLLLLSRTEPKKEPKK